MRKPAAILFVLSLAILALAMIPAAGLAAQGGNGNGAEKGNGGGNGGGGTAPSTASVNVSPNPAAAGGARVDVTGCGYAFRVAEIRIEHSAGYTETYVNGVWADGCMNPTYFLTREAGTYTVNVYQANSDRRNATQVLMASDSLVVG